MAVVTLCSPLALNMFRYHFETKYINEKFYFFTLRKFYPYFQQGLESGKSVTRTVDVSNVV